MTVWLGIVIGFAVGCGVGLGGAFIWMLTMFSKRMKATSENTETLNAELIGYWKTTVTLWEEKNATLAKIAESLGKCERPQFGGAR